MIPYNNFISSSTRRILWIWLLAGISFILLPITSSFGRDISFVWTANTGTIDGYKLYYKTGTSGTPYDGTGATEGPSPVTTGNVTSFTLHGLSDTETYYFTLTAYVGSQESGYATEIVAPPVSANRPPTASGASVSTNENSPLTGQLSANDPDGDALTYSIVTNGTLGSAVINNQATGAFTYTPNTDATGNDSFSFKVNDGTVDSNTATVNVAIAVTAAANAPPTASGASVSTDENSPLTGQLSANDPNGDALTYSIVTNGTLGSAVINNQATGAFTYTPNTDATGNDSFSFKVNDGTVDSNTATVNVAIAVTAAANAPPTASGASVSTNENSPLTGQLSANDPDGDALTYSIVTSGNLGSAVINDQATGAFTYTPNTDATGNDSFSFKVNDGTVDSNTATVNVAILPASTVTKIFGDTPDADYPGTLADTYTNINHDINAAAATLMTYSWSSPAPHKIANTIIIKADLASIPSAATIQEARLYLYQTGANGEAEYNNSIHMITDKDPQIDQVSGYNAYNGEPWTPVPANTTYNDVPLGLADIGPAADTVLLNTRNGYRSWLITKMVQEWIRDPSTNHGLLIEGETTAVETGRNFAASENQNAAIRPKLVVRYTLHQAPKLILIKEIN